MPFCLFHQVGGPVGGLQGVIQKAQLAGGIIGLPLQGGDIHAASRSIPIVWADNFSIGMTVFCRMARQMAQTLGADFDMEIVETHHNQKADAPSGMRMFTDERGGSAHADAKSACMRCAAARLRANTACAFSGRWRNWSCATVQTAVKFLRAARSKRRSLRKE